MVHVLHSLLNNNSDWHHQGGWVTYVDEATALNNKYVVVSSGVVYIGVDTTSVLSPTGPGRQAFRLVSNDVFNHGLIVGDFAHMRT